MSLVLDTEPIVAALNKLDQDHERCAALIDGAVDLLTPSPVLVEIDYWLTKLAGQTCGALSSPTSCEAPTA